MKMRLRRFREVYKFEYRGKPVLADNFAVWEDLGNGCLQPTVSTQTTPIMELVARNDRNIVLNKDWRYVGFGPIRVHTSMNNSQDRIPLNEYIEWAEKWGLKMIGQYWQ